MNATGVTSRVFVAMQNLNISELAEYPQREIRPILPSLVRMSLLSPLDNTKSSMDSRREILSLLVGIEVVNNIVAFLQVNYHELEADLKKEQQLRQKIGFVNDSSTHSFGLQNGIALGFERADVTRKVRVVLSEIFHIQSQLLEPRTQAENLIKHSELFDDGIYLEEITDIICIALAELPSLLSLQELIETLIFVNNGAAIICSIVANFPDCYKDVISNLIANIDEDSPDGKLKLSVLMDLSDMNPPQALATRALCVELMKVPSLMLRLSLKDPQGLIAFISGLILGNDTTARTWFAGFVRSSQKRKSDALQLIREELLRQLQDLVGGAHAKSKEGADDYTVQASALLRLYCALRGIAGIKFMDEELQLIMQLVTTKPLPTAAGIRFVSLGLCMLIACPSLISNTGLEQKAIEWLQWLIKEEAYFENKAGVTASFGEMLLLMAIHFHSNQTSAIGELVCSTLSMKIPIRPNNTTRMKQIFTQDLFTEQVVAAHAVKVPVTMDLNANIPGYLPIHCIHQLLKSRAFLKHKVTIKSWIYKQICSCVTPLHPVMPALIEVYVNSLIIPGKAAGEHMHTPLSENEIFQVFRNSIVGGHVDGKNQIYGLDYFELTTSGDSVENKENQEFVQKSNITSQLLILYYLILYEDVRLSNMVTILTSGRKVKSYSTEFLSELPIKYLLQEAQKDQHQYVGLFHPLLKLLITHFPHLSLVDDWIEEDHILASVTSGSWFTSFELQEQQLIAAFDELYSNPSKITRILHVMVKKPPTEIWKFAEILVSNINRVLETSVPRLIQGLYRKVWMRLNSVLPRRLWTMTINTLMPNDANISKYALTHENIVHDPLQVLRCNSKVFRSPEALAIVLRILQASLAASKSQLNRHLQDQPAFDRNGQVQNENEREELKTALVASQESAAVQILLESCLATSEDVENFGNSWALREVRGIVCSYIHQVFISEPPLARLVHFQTYPNELLSITVRGIPSMHICIDFLGEILSMPEMEKQIFAIDLTSYLSLQYAIPKSLSVAKLCINTLSTLLGLLSSEARIEMFSATLPVVVRFAEAFPVLIDDCVNFLMQLGRIVHAQATLGRSGLMFPILSLQPGSKAKIKSNRTLKANRLMEDIRKTFSSLVDRSINKHKIY